jgi:hypothetical protein
MKAFRLALLAAAAISSVAALLPSAAAARGCSKFALPEAFSIKQSDGPAVTIRLSADRRGKVTGSAAWGYPRKIGEIRSGSFDDRVLSFRILWSGGSTGTYEGSINQKNKFIGVVRSRNVVARFESLQQFPCVN